MKIQFPYYLLFFLFFSFVFFCLLVSTNCECHVVLSPSSGRRHQFVTDVFPLLSILHYSKKLSFSVSFALARLFGWPQKKKHFAWNYLCSIFLPVCQLVGESASWRWEVTFSRVAWKRQCHRHIVITRKSGNDGSDITGRRTVWFRQRRQQYGTIDHPSFFICFLSSFPNSSCLTVMFW